ncbi:MAG: hypothetical protein AAFO94_12560 [Bacteroidota bacterium]
MVDHALFLWFTGITAAAVGFALAWLWRSGKIKHMSTTLDQLKSSFSYLEAEHSKMALYLNAIQKEKEQFSAHSRQQTEIIESLRLNLSQLETDRQNIINAFNTYKEQTVDRIKQELDQTKLSNEELRLKYRELIDLQERNYALVIDLTQRREAKTIGK